MRALGFRVEGLGFRTYGLEFTVLVLGLGRCIEGSVLRVQVLNG